MGGSKNQGPERLGRRNSKDILCDSRHYLWSLYIGICHPVCLVVCHRWDRFIPFSDDPVLEGLICNYFDHSTTDDRHQTGMEEEKR